MKYIILLLTISSCALAPGQGNKVMMSNEKFIMIKYTKLLSESDDAYVIAEKHCQSYNKHAVLSSETKDGLAMRNVTFQCQL